MAAVRLHLAMGAVLLTAAGCAGQPQQASPGPPVTAAAPSPAAARPLEPSLTDVPGLTPHILAMAREDGYRPRVKDGDVLFCRREIPVGTTLPHLHCVNPTGLRWEVEQEQEQRRDLRQASPTMCQGMGC